MTDSSIEIRRVCKIMGSGDRVTVFYLFITLSIGIAAGFSFAYILLLFTEYPIPLQMYNYRRPLNESEFQETDKSIGEELVKKVRVYCFVLTQPKNHKVKAMHVKATWGKRCNKLFFISSVVDKTLPSLKLQSSEEGNFFLWGKTKAAFRYLYEHHKEDADWFLKADDDTYVIVENLRYFLADYDTQDPIYFGCRFKKGSPQGYMSGGAGYVLSRDAALLRFVTQALPDPLLCRTSDFGIEDVEMGKCLYNVGVQAMDSHDEQKRGRFFPFRPEDHLFLKMGSSFWFLKYILEPPREGLSCCSDYAITFHSIQPGMMYELEYLLYHLRPYGFHHESGPRPRLPTGK